ncbi:UNVERIFIED_CONTAM: hypothetical protein PYX00_009831 [Menopon gallinae]
MEAILKRQADRKKQERNGSVTTSLTEVERFTDIFNKKQKTIENQLQLLKSINPCDQKNLSNHVAVINSDIQELQKLYSNATLYLRIYDKKVFQESLQLLQSKLQTLENELLPKKKFGFKLKKNNFDCNDLNFRGDEMKSASAGSDLALNSFVGISGKTNEELRLDAEQVNKRDIMLKDLKSCSVHLKGVPTTLHAANIDSCKFYFGPITTSVFLENVKDSVVSLACQQLRIHDTVNTDFYVHVTSKSVIENCKDVRFGVYNVDYEGLEEDYEMSGLNKQINNWDQVDDFNWLITNKPSPNWSKIC